MSNPASGLDEERALALAWQAVEQAGGTRSIYRNPRMAFALNATRELDIDGYPVEIRYGEISTPAIVSVAGWVFEVHDEDLELLMKPRKR